MRRRHELIYSPAMGRRMNIWCFGHWGTPLLVFPSAAGFAHEWDLQGMVDALAPLIQGGRLKLYCPESNVSQSWTDKGEHPALRVKAHLAYERFVLDDLVPAIRRDCASDSIRLAVSGVSLGALYSANFALKHPEIFFYALCMSGRYDASGFTQGYVNGDIYFNSPLHYLPNLDGAGLERVTSQTFLALVCGQGAWERGCIEETIALGDVCSAKGVPHFRDIWGHDSSHDWAWWRRQARHHLGQRFGG
ncbi:MAG: alpha/beta hydrolase-fold protein [Acidobacteriota bacterium]